MRNNWACLAIIFPSMPQSRSKGVPRAPMSAYLAAFGLAILSLPQLALAEWKLNFQEPASQIAQEQYDLHLIILVIITLIGLGVFAVMVYSIIMHRKDKGHKAATFHENTAVELAWTIIPFIIIFLMAFPATRVILAAKDASSPDLTIKAIGYQWKWGYDYLDDNVFFYSSLSTPIEQIGPLMYEEYGVITASEDRTENYLLEVDNPMVVPVNQKVRLLLTAADVLHSWWVPQLGVKQDAIPGIVREAWFQADRTGTYRGQCAELCGKNHGFMPIVVEVLSQEDYLAWVADMGGGAKEIAAPIGVGDVEATAPVAQASATGPAEWVDAEVMAYGKGLYEVHCVACHQANGEGLPPTFPGLVGSPLTTGPAAGHIDIVLNGKEGTTMASFAHLGDAEIAAIIHYERHAWGNNAGDLVTPDDIAAAR